MLKEDDKNKLRETALELEREAAITELRESMLAALKRERKHETENMREQVFRFMAENPGLSPAEVAERFGLRDHTIRAWKAHRTMGTYRSAPEAKKPDESEPEPLFNLNKKRQRKRGFALRKRQTGFIHFFDKTPPGIVCPHFYILAFANGCPFKCSYCYLNLTLRHWPEPTVFSNTARMYQEVRDWLYATKTPSVMNAGELSDSLAWDDEIRLTADLAPLFASQTRHKLLLLTKSANIGELLKLEPSPQVIVSFSVNSSEVSKKFEKNAPAPELRLAAARQLKKKGFAVRLRLDPVIPLPDWRKNYQAVVDEINRIQPEIVTLGSLRFFPGLRSHSSGDGVFEFGTDQGDPDGRWRIPFEQRAEIYRFILDRLETPKTGLCKETAQMHSLLGFAKGKQSCNCSID
jgi:spore photoproduct lyase